MNALQRYARWVGEEDCRKAIDLAEEINGDQAEVVRLEAQYREAARELKRLRSTGALAPDITAQEGVVNGLVARLRNAEAGVREDRAYARFFYRGQFKR